MEVAKHVALRATATPEEAEQLRGQYAAELERTVRDPAPTRAALAKNVRALIRENDLDATHAGLAEIADVLEQLE